MTSGTSVTASIEPRDSYVQTGTFTSAGSNWVLRQVSGSSTVTVSVPYWNPADSQPYLTNDSAWGGALGGALGGAFGLVPSPFQQLQPLNLGHEDMATRERSTHMQKMIEKAAQAKTQAQSVVAALYEMEAELRRTRDTVAARNATIQVLRHRVDELELRLINKADLEAGRTQEIPRLVLSWQKLHARTQACAHGQRALQQIDRAGHGLPESTRTNPTIEVTVESLKWALTDRGFCVSYSPLSWIERVAPKIAPRWQGWMRNRGERGLVDPQTGVCILPPEWLYLQLLQLTITEPESTGLAEGTRYVPAPAADEPKAIAASA